MNAPVTPAAFETGHFEDSRFTVPGIRCAGCIAKIERELGKHSAIDSVRVNFSAKRVAIRHLPELDDDNLIAALAGLGFEAQRLDDNPVAEDVSEARLLQRSLAVAGFGMMNVMLLSVSVWSGAEGSTRDLFHWLSAIIALPVIAYSGRPFFASAWMALRNRRTNMDVPISIGVLLATGLSLYETVAGGGHSYFESAVMLLFFLLAGRTLDAAMRSRTRAGIGALLSRMGRSAQVIGPDGRLQSIAAEDLRPGMVMLVAAGEALAADGIIEQGSTSIDNAMLTGESRPEARVIGDEVHAGATNLTAPVRVRITAAASDTVLAEIARLMDEAGQSRSRYVRIADRASRLYAPAVHSLALLAFIGWMIAGAGVHQSLVIAIAVLIITCPCAMGLAVPAAQVVTTGALLKHGMLIKDGSALERFAEVDLAVFDKTGTLTMGAPAPDLSSLDDDARRVALALSSASCHPLSTGLAVALRDAGVVSAELSDIAERSGEGVFASWRGIDVALERPDTAQSEIAVQLRIGTTRTVVNFTDPVRTDAGQTMAVLDATGIESRILSGDASDAVARVARELGVHARAGASPQDKLETLEHLHRQGRRPLMVGDGINDGPALAAAHASIAPGSASDISQQAADAVFTGSNLMPVAVTVRGARACAKVVRQNFGFAIVYNVLAVPLALAGLVTPLIAAIAMSASSIIVVANSLRLRSLVR
ncbi:heavy metal translocating P-type ATPase [Aurantiacibacter sp. D1-12]|uniref:heavy metal translocating P-type ATPase n=1 Tax=Aurantiacibacter sp. D1-12 TaxID=2993658 RepID=UPI00237CA44F|nr:heavy metal translocating P-type ATPase [Aurantiacibacter sp. D1-12]MDE1467755.1 heavy metal translocating P-type ATPase [Aurantiacibacter sp. D1-12]